MIDIENLQTEVQTRADALTGASPDKQIVEVGIAARSIQMTGAEFDRTLLDIAIQDAIDEVSGSTSNAQLIALAAAVPRASAAASSTEVGTYVPGLFNGNTKYLQCNGGTYLRSAYPDLTTDAISSLAQQVSISASELTNLTPAPTTETQPSVYKVGSTYYKLTGGTSTSAGWQVVPIQTSSDGIHFTQVSAPTMASPITSSNGAFQMDTLLSSGTSLLALGRLHAGTSDSMCQLKSVDAGKTWMFSNLRSTSGLYSNPAYPVLAAVIGNTVIAHVKSDQATSVFCSTNFGTSWSSASDTDLVNTKTITGIVADGTRFMVGFSDGSSTYSATNDPAGTTWTAVAPPNANARGVLGIVAGKWVMGGVSGYVATCTSLGTWVLESTCTSGMPTLAIDRILVNGTTIAFSGLSTTSQVFYCTDASTLPVAVSVTTDQVVTNTTKINLASVADGQFYLRHVGQNLVSSTTLNVDSFTSAQLAVSPTTYNSFDTVNYGIVKKFGLYFYSVGGAGQNTRYVSSDMKTWTYAAGQVTFGCGAIVDAGTRLLAIDVNNLLWQSTDGVTWDTTGITRPTLTGTVYSSAARLFVCANGWIYFVVFRSSDTSYFVFVSKNDGATWSTVSGLSFAGSGGYSNVLQNPDLFKEINGKIYSLSLNYFTSNYGYYLNSSSDGTLFNYVTGASNSFSAGSYSRRHGIFDVDGVLYVVLGGDTSTYLASYNDGLTFSVVPSTFVPATVSVLALSTSWFIRNSLSTDEFMYLRTSSPDRLTRLSVSDLSTSVNYAAGESNISTGIIYESGAIKMLTPAQYGLVPTAPKLVSLTDSNMTFTLPNISNTWLRART